MNLIDLFTADLADLCICPHRRGEATALFFTLRLANGTTIKGISHMATLVLKDIDALPVTLTLDPRDNAGNSAQIENTTWSTTDESIAALAVAEGGLSATLTKTGKAGQARIDVVADGHIGEGEAILSATLDLTVLPGDAVNLNLAVNNPNPA